MLNFQPKLRLLYNERLTDLIGETPPPKLPAPITDPELQETLTFTGESNITRMILPKGPTVCIQAKGERDPAMFPYVQLYSMADKPFYCIEPWTGHPNALNSVFGTRRLAPGSEEKAALQVWAE